MRRPQNLKKSPTSIDKTVVFTKKCQIKWEIFSNFCGFLRKAELYEIFFLNERIFAKNFAKKL